MTKTGYLQKDQDDVQKELEQFAKKVIEFREARRNHERGNETEKQENEPFFPGLEGE